MDASRSRFTRRAVARGISAAGLTGFVIRPRALAQTPAIEGWEFTDFREVTVSLPSVPTRIAAQTTSAASLWDFGIEVLGFFGPNDAGTDFEFPQIGDMDVDSMTYLGDWGELDLEKLVESGAEIYVDLYRGGESLWYLGDVATEERVLAICPTIGVNANGIPFMETVEEFEHLAVSLGVDPEGQEIVDAKAALAEAEGAFKAAIDGKGEIKVVAISMGTDGNAYLWNGNWLSDMQYLRDLGISLVDVGVADDVPNALVSVEQLGNYHADVYLVDSRETLDAYLANPVWNSLPAVQAGQVGWWYSSVLYSYQSLAEVLHLYSEVLTTAEPLA